MRLIQPWRMSGIPPTTQTIPPTAPTLRLRGSVLTVSAVKMPVALVHPAVDRIVSSMMQHAVNVTVTDTTGPPGAVHAPGVLVLASPAVHAVSVTWSTDVPLGLGWTLREAAEMTVAQKAADVAVAPGRAKVDATVMAALAPPQQAVKLTVQRAMILHPAPAGASS